MTVYEGSGTYGPIITDVNPCLYKWIYFENQTGQFQTIKDPHQGDNVYGSFTCTISYTGTAWKIEWGANVKFVSVVLHAE